MRGVILSIEKRFSYILDETGSFRKIYRKNSHQVGGEIEVSKPRSGGSRRGRVRMIAAIAACFVVMVGGYAFADKWDGAAYSLYVDINPSVKLEVNDFDQVISQQSLNPDGVALLNNAKPNGAVISALGSLISEAAQTNHITDNGVTITMVGGDKVKYNALSSLIEEAFGKIGIRFLHSTPEEEAFALKNGATPYQYDLAKRVNAKYPNLAIATAVRLPAGYLEDLLSGKEVL